MIEYYRGLAVFVAVADAGSFSAAGRQLKLSTSVVSHHVSKLEAKLGVPLFFRSTRSLSLTAEGAQILDSARRMVQAGEEAMDVLSDQTDQPVGALTISLPGFGDSQAVHQAIWAFARQHPMVALTIHSSDRQVDMIREGYDLAIRLGQLTDSTLKTRRIGSFERVLVAAPAYLAERPPITTLAELAACDFVSFSRVADGVTLVRDGEEVTLIPDNVRLELDSVNAVRAALIAGLGLHHLPVSEVADDIAQGRLVQVLPEWQLPILGVFAVWPDSGAKKKLTRRLIDHLLASSRMSR